MKLFYFHYIKLTNLNEIHVTLIHLFNIKFEFHGASLIIITTVKVDMLLSQRIEDNDWPV